MENLLEEGRSFRHRKKQSDPICCPVCGVTIRAAEIEQHYALEVDRLMKLKIKKPISNGSTYHDPLPGCSSNGDESSGCPWVTFQKIRSNRHSRLRIKTRKRKTEEPICPVCNERPTEDINVHVELCLRRSEGSTKTNGTPSDDDESIDIEGESFDEYEWAGQKRVRASSLLHGGYSATGIGTPITNSSNNDDEDEDLNVDGDDTQIYGPPQYTERDVIVPLGSECEKEELENNYLRKLVTGQDVMTNSSSSGSVANRPDDDKSCLEHSNHNSNSMNSSNNNNNNINQLPNDNATTIGDDIPLDCRSGSKSIAQPSAINSPYSTTSNSGSISNSNNGACGSTNSHQTVAICGGGTTSTVDNGDSTAAAAYQSSYVVGNQIIESLKAKIREYENQITNKIKCLICMDEFRNPAVSICCWHVHCEECWLRTLGARKLCPQCNMITSPSDLRRIYM